MRINSESDSLFGKLVHKRFPKFFYFTERFSEINSVFKNTEPSNEKLRLDTWRHVHKLLKKGADEREGVLVIGDSMGKDLVNALSYSGHPWSDHLTYIRTDCSDMPSHTHSDFAQFDKIFISFLYKTQEQVDCGEALLAELLDSGLEVIVVSPLYFKSGDELQKYTLDELERRARSDYWTGLYFRFAPVTFFTLADFGILNSMNPIALSYQNYHSIDSRVHVFGRQLWQFCNGRNGCSYLDKIGAMCDRENEMCPLLSDSGSKIYFDNQHLTLYGAKLFGGKISSLLQSE